ncbi:MAG TPA: DMT family transporter [Mizugakiibacter sp.]
MPETRRATLAGFGAILLWSTLALLSRGAGRLPPWQLLASGFAVGTLATFAASSLRHGPRAALARCAQPWPAFALGFGALFGFHALYFHALARAPAAQASLIVYLWPLLIALGAGARDAATRPRRALAALCGLAATALAIGADPTALAREAWFGYLLALACALVWAGYSLANARFAALPAETLIPACAATALAGAVVHLAGERWVAPSAHEWLAVVLLGIGPVGTAFLLWDAATKRGDLGLLGVAAYAAPVLSTALLVAAGLAPARAALLGAALLVAVALALARPARRAA